MNFRFEELTVQEATEKALLLTFNSLGVQPTLEQLEQFKEISTALVARVQQELTKE